MVWFAEGNDINKIDIDGNHIKTKVLTAPLPVTSEFSFVLF